jgi:hypothetical protein
MKPIQVISQDLFDKVRSRFTNLEMGDETGSVTIDPADARFFDFDFVSEGINLGRVSISINDGGSLKVYYSQGITENQDDPAKKEWFGFLREMRMFAMRRLLRFDTRDIAKTNLDKNDFQHLATTQGPKEEDMTTMNESRWNHKSSKKTSRAVQGATEVIVRHSKPVDEMYAGARSQRKNIKAIFIQNADGERFKYPFIHPAGAFAMAQHVDHGGVPHDPAGKAIIGMSEEIAKLGQFRETIRKATLHDDAIGITERAIGRLNELKATIEALGKRHHYENWINEFTEDESIDSMGELDSVTMEQYKEKFTQTNFQEELTGYFPLLHRIMSETNKIDLEDYVEEERTETKDEHGNVINWKEEGDWKKSDDKDPKGKVYNLSDKARRETEKSSQKEGTFEAFEEWAEAVEQGKLTDYQIELLKKAIARQEQAGQPLQLGPNGKTAWDFFSGAINPDDAEGSAGAEFSDELKHKLEVAAREFPDTDAMEVFQSWANKDYPELAVALGMSGGEEPAQEPETTPVPSQEQPTEENEEMGGKPNELMTKESMIKEIAKLVKSRYNKDNPDVGPFNGKENIALDVKKSIAEKFGEEAGCQAEEMATMFMEKLSKDWEQRHGKVGDDGLARLKELLDNIKGKVESIGDRGTSTTDFNTNIMPAEGAFKDADTGIKQPLKVPGQKDALPDVMKKGEVVKSLDKSRSFFGKTYEELDTIRKLSGLAK